MTWTHDKEAAYQALLTFEALDEKYSLEFGCEYRYWPTWAKSFYAEQALLVYGTITYDEAAIRFACEENPKVALDETVAFWTSVVRGDKELT